MSRFIVEEAFFWKIGKEYSKSTAAALQIAYNTSICAASGGREFSNCAGVILGATAQVVTLADTVLEIIGDTLDQAIEDYLFELPECDEESRIPAGTYTGEGSWQRPWNAPVEFTVIVDQIGHVRGISTTENKTDDGYLSTPFEAIFASSEVRVDAYGESNEGTFERYTSCFSQSFSIDGTPGKLQSLFVLLGADGQMHVRIGNWANSFSSY